MGKRPSVHPNRRVFGQRLKGRPDKSQTGNFRSLRSDERKTRKGGEEHLKRAPSRGDGDQNCGETLYSFGVIILTTWACDKLGSPGRRKRSMFDAGGPRGEEYRHGDGPTRARGSSLRDITTGPLFAVSSQVFGVGVLVPPLRGAGQVICCDLHEARHPSVHSADFQRPDQPSSSPRYEEHAFD
ncbi:hypothetical protein CIRG_01975 [Coccidioides immitis RMSCC 2394]|uniref:Uncharacterized protein n=1 Tax=Coccidioides immitis RMSCC 2394 TaxID=404692 RepID=A0A0J6XZR9_COCIT|nr:hypothetical protein CIRG_01975 [Coccidioides immitis RMSCC 2394]